MVRATGGGAYKYEEVFKEAIGVRLVHVDEMASVVAGLNYLIGKEEREVYRFRESGGGGMDGKKREEGARVWVGKNGNPFPYLLVNIGTGVSILKVTDHDCFERVSGSSLGGGTFWGLARLLLNCKTFDEVIELTNREKADNSNVDMMVRDIYGGDYKKLGLDEDVIAASFGKVVMKKDHGTLPSVGAAWRGFVRFLKGTWFLWLNFWFAVPVIGTILALLGIERKSHWSLANLALNSHFNAQDVAMSLLRMVSYNIGQIAYLNARRYDLSTIYFGGNFIRDHPHTMAAISFAVDFWSNGATQALFLRHDGYLGAVGAFLNGTSKSQNGQGSVKTQNHVESNGTNGSSAKTTKVSPADNSSAEKPKTPRKKRRRKSRDVSAIQESTTPANKGEDRKQQTDKELVQNETKKAGKQDEHAEPPTDIPEEFLENGVPVRPDRDDPPSPPWVEVTRPRKRKLQKN